MMSHALNEFDVRNAAESEAFRQVARTANSVKYSHSERDGGCSVEVHHTTATVKVTMDRVFGHRYDSVKLRNVKRKDLTEIFRNPGAKIIYQRPNPFYICSHLNDNCNRKLFMSPDAPIDGALKSISLGYDCSTFLILYTDDSFSHSSGIPSRLYHKLLGRQEHLPRPELVRLGLRSPHSFFIQYADGSMDSCDLPRELEFLLPQDGVNR